MPGRRYFGPRAARVDISQAPIVRALKAAGASVEILPGAGGRPDLIVGYCRQTILMECKTPGMLKKHKAHAANQAAWRDSWRGGAVHVVTTPEEALRAVGAMES